VQTDVRRRNYNNSLFITTPEKIALIQNIHFLITYKFVPTKCSTAADVCKHRWLLARQLFVTGDYHINMILLSIIFR